MFFPKRCPGCLAVVPVGGKRAGWSGKAAVLCVPTPFWHLFSTSKRYSSHYDMHEGNEMRPSPLGPSLEQDIES